MVATQRWVHLPRLAVELPEGWTASESAVFTSPAGLSITAATSRPPDGADPHQLAHQHRQVLAESLAEFSETKLEETTAFGGVLVVGRRFAFKHDDTTWCGRTIYAIVDGVSCTVSAGWPAERFPARGADEEFDVAVRGVWLLADFAPLNERGAAPTEAKKSAESTAAGHRSPVEPSVWQTLHSAWSDPTPRSVVAAEHGGSSRWSEDELQLCAALLGAAVFPTVNPERLVAQPEATRSAIVDAVGRSLVARHVIRAEDGRTTLTEETQAQLELAVFPDLVVQAERFCPAGLQTWWYGLRRDRAIEVSVESDGSRTCASMASAELVRRIATLTGWGNCRAGAGEARTIRPENVFDEGEDVRAVVRIRTLWREGPAGVGGVVQWAFDVDGGTYAVVEESTQSGTRWHLQPSDAEQTREELLAHLPGGDRT